jgi:hypothetical protein
MTREEFIKVLDGKGYSYEIEGDKLLVTYRGTVALGDIIESIPSDVVFKNRNHVLLRALKTLPQGTVFQNKGDVELWALEELPQGTVFNNTGTVVLRYIDNIPSSTIVNGNGIFFGGRKSWISSWENRIEGISFNRLLNLMIKQGIFER